MPHRPIAAALAVLVLTACGDKPRSAETPEWVKTGEIPGGDPFAELDGKPKKATEKATDTSIEKAGEKPAKTGAEPKTSEPIAVTKSGETPVWAKTPPKQEGMLFGIASVAKNTKDAREVGKNRARADLIEQISVSIKAETKLYERSTDQTFGGKRTETAFMDLTSDIQSKAEQKIEGITVREIVETPKDLWVLVACDRAAWAANIRKQIQDVDQNLTKAGEDLKEAKGVAAFARLSKRILPLSAERLVLLRQLRVADPQGELPKSPIDVDLYKTDLAKALDTVTIGVTAKIGAGGANDALLNTRIAGALGNAGLGVVAEGKPAQLHITFVARFQELVIDEEKKRVNATLAASFTGADGKQLGSLEAKGSGLSTPSIARDKAVDEAVKNVLVEFEKQIFDLVARL
jgi:hypothetical protein